MLGLRAPRTVNFEGPFALHFLQKPWQILHKLSQKQHFLKGNKYQEIAPKLSWTKTLKNGIFSFFFFLSWMLALDLVINILCWSIVARSFHWVKSLIFLSLHWALELDRQYNRNQERADWYWTKQARKGFSIEEYARYINNSLID